MTSKYDICRVRVNGSLLSDYHNKQVCLLGTFLKMENAGTTQILELKTSDNKVATVNMSTPIQEYLEGILEVHGLVGKNNVIECEYFVLYPKESIQNFDMTLYDEAIQLMSQNPRYYTTG